MREDSELNAVDWPELIVPDGADEPRHSLGIQSVEIGMVVLSTLVQVGRPQSLAGIARLCGMPRTKLHRYLTSLERSGYVEREPGSGHYRLGGKSVRLGLAALAQLDFPRLGSEMLPAICRDLGETVFLTVWGQHGATIVRWEDTGQPIAVNVRVGSTMPLLRSATGQVFGAFLHETTVRPFVRAELNAVGLGTGPANEAEAAVMFEEVRRAGVGRVSGTFLASISAVAAPVFDQAGQLAGAITSLGLLGSFPEQSDGALAQSLLRWARKLSAQLGAPGPLVPGFEDGA